jgi:hypothetical protein
MHPRLHHANRGDFDWHCATFFDFRKGLGAADLAYLDYCFGVTGDTPDTVDISSRTFGHKLGPEHVNSSRLGWGFRELTPAHATRIDALVTHHLGPRPELRTLLAEAAGAGVAWDVELGDLKVYYFFEHWRELPSAFGPPDPQLAAQSRDETIIALTFRGGTRIEDKTYYYPRRSAWPPLIRAHAAHPELCTVIASLAKRLAFVTSTTSKYRLQFDVAPSEQSTLLDALADPRATDIATRCRARALVLDTVAVDRDGLGLYFE